MKKVTIDHVAKRAGVSIGTVSAVINNKNIVRQQTRDAVLHAMRELKYRPRGSAQTLKNVDGELGSIGLLIRELDNPFYMGIATGVREYANKRGYLVVIASSEGDHTYEEKITRNFSRTDRKGAIIAPVLEGTAEIEHLFKLKMINFPIVLLEGVKGIRTSVVSIDNIRAMKLAMKYLFDGGHSRILHFAGPSHASHTFERNEGFRRAYSESHHAFTGDMIVPAGAHIDDGYRTCLEYFRHRARADYPTAIICYNDLVALGVMAALAELGVRVPQDVSVVGNDDIPFARHNPVQLTTIHTPQVELGRKAAEILIANIESTRRLPVEHVVLEAQLVVRKSTRILDETPADHFRESQQTVIL